jgi:hypothetical protein
MNLSLEVARIVHPEYEWFVSKGGRVSAWIPKDDEDIPDLVTCIHFDHTTPEAGFHMTVWLAKKWDSEGNEDAMETIGYMLARNPTPNARLAKAIVETHNG